MILYYPLILSSKIKIKWKINKNKNSLLSLILIEMLEKHFLKYRTTRSLDNELLEDKIWKANSYLDIVRVLTKS